MNNDNCLLCNIYLIGKQQKFCGCKCRSNYNALRVRKEKFELRQIEIEQRFKQIISGVNPMNYLRLNSSAMAFNEAKQLLKWNI